MTEKSFFWGGTTVGDATLAPYDDDEFSDYTRLFLQLDRTKDVVFPYLLGSGSLLLTNITTTLYLAAGQAMVDGKMYVNDATLSFTVTVPGSGSNFYAVALRKDFAAQTVRAVLLGPSTLAFPTPTQTDGVTWEVVLWQIEVDSAANYSIYDRRIFFGSIMGSQTPVGYPKFTNVLLGGQSNEIENTPSPDPTDVALYNAIIGGINNVISDSGEGNVILGGLSTVVSGDGNVAMGNDHSVAGSYNVVMGKNGRSQTGESYAMVHGGDIGDEAFAVPQFKRLIGGDVIASHTNTTWYDIFIFTIRRVATVEIFITGATSGAAQAWSYKIEASVKYAGTTYSVLASTVTEIYESDANYAAQLVTDIDGFHVQVRRNGGVDYAVRWMATVHASEMYLIS